MCLLVYKPAEGKFSEEHRRESWRCNSHGGGMAYIKSGEDRVTYTKGIMDVETFIETAKRTEGITAILHFRIASVGKRTPENTHPFIVGNSGWVMAHNGTIQGMDIQGDESDTSAFCRDVLTPLMENNPEQIFDADTQKALEARIGGSKVILFGPDGRKVILNERLGHWKDGTWFSNSSYIIPTYTPHYRGDGPYAGYDNGDYWEEEFQRRADERRLRAAREQYPRPGPHGKIIAGVWSLTYKEFSPNGNLERTVTNGHRGEWLWTKEYLRDERKKMAEYRRAQKKDWRQKIVDHRMLVLACQSDGMFVELWQDTHCSECAEVLLGTVVSYYHVTDKRSVCKECALKLIIDDKEDKQKDFFQSQKEVQDFLGRGQKPSVPYVGWGEGVPEGSEKGLTDGELYEQEALEMERSSIVDLALEEQRILGITQHEVR